MAEGRTEVVTAAASGAVGEGTGIEDGEKGVCHFILIVLLPLFKKKKGKYDKMLTSVHSG